MAAPSPISAHDSACAHNPSQDLSDSTRMYSRKGDDNMPDAEANSPSCGQPSSSQWHKYRQEHRNDRKRGISHRSIACNYCREKKTRCSGSNPCSNCASHGVTCVFVEKRKYGQRTKERKTPQNKERTERFALVEELLQYMKSADLANVKANHLRIQDRSLGPDQLDSSQEAFSTPASRARPTSAISATTEAVPGQNSDTMTNVLGSMNFLGGTCLSGTSDEAETPRLWRNFRSEAALEFLEPQQAQTAASPVPPPPPPPSRKPLPPPRSLTNASIVDSVATSCPCSQRDMPDPPSEDAPPRHCNGLPSDAAVRPDEVREGSSIHSSQRSHYEYQGPRSIFSICSKPGIEWVSEKTRNRNFSHTAADFMKDVTRRLKIGKSLSKDTIPEPQSELAWTYTRAYFEEALDAGLGIVHRPWFESRLKMHLDGENFDDDPCWYALRNVIYASGCRIVSARCESFREANRLAWRFFENALHVHTEVLYFRTSLMGVQTLTLMAYFTENIANPCLEYMLCTAALRQAVAMGLHRQPVPSWNLTQEEQCQRGWLFWTVYCLEKQICLRSGRPSAIDDEDISCQVPANILHGGVQNMSYCCILIQLAKISSSAGKRFSTVQAFRQPQDVLVKTVCQLNEQLTLVRNQYESCFAFEPHLQRSEAPRLLSHKQTVYLQYAYHNTVFDIHTVLTYPWSESVLGLARDHPSSKQVNHSEEIVAATSRVAILALHQIEIDASTPVPLNFYGPMCAIINLFIHVLRNPSHSCVQSDLALMEAGAGHFARLQFITDFDISIPFVREMVALAYDAVHSGSATRSFCMRGQSSANETPHVPYASQFPLRNATESLDEPAVDQHEIPDVRTTTPKSIDVRGLQLPSQCGHLSDSLMPSQISMVDNLDFEMDNSSILLPLFDFDEAFTSEFVP